MQADPHCSPAGYGLPALIFFAIMITALYQGFRKWDTVFFLSIMKAPDAGKILSRRGRLS
jgi:hypothetical protein